MIKGKGNYKQVSLRYSRRFSYFFIIESNQNHLCHGNKKQSQTLYILEQWKEYTHYPYTNIVSIIICLPELRSAIKPLYLLEKWKEYTRYPYTNMAPKITWLAEIRNAMTLYYSERWTMTTPEGNYTRLDLIRKKVMLLSR